MVIIFTERNFVYIFEKFHVYCYAILVAMGWECLVYELDSFYVYAITNEFYNGFSKSNISNDHKSLTIKWWGRTIHIHSGTISVVTGIIILGNGNKISKATEEYVSKVGITRLHVIVELAA